MILYDILVNQARATEEEAAINSEGKFSYNWFLSWLIVLIIELKFNRKQVMKNILKFQSAISFI